MENDKGKTTLVLTYDRVRGYGRGVYQEKDCQVAILCENLSRCYSWGCTAEDLGKTLSHLTPPISLEEVGKIYLYVGSEIRLVLPLAAELKAKGKDLELVACDCCFIKTKTEAAQKMGVPLIWTYEGDRTLGELVDKLLGKAR